MGDVVVLFLISRSRRRSFWRHVPAALPQSVTRSVLDEDLPLPCSSRQRRLKTFPLPVSGGQRGCSTLLAIPAAQRRGTGSRGEIPQGFTLSRCEYGGAY